MSYFDKPKKTPIAIHRVENGYLVNLGFGQTQDDVETYIATSETLMGIVAQALDVAKSRDDEALEKWKEKEEKTAEGYEWSKKKGEQK